VGPARPDGTGQFEVSTGRPRERMRKNTCFALIKLHLRVIARNGVSGAGRLTGDRGSGTIERRPVGETSMKDAWNVNDGADLGRRDPPSHPADLPSPIRRLGPSRRRNGAMIRVIFGPGGLEGLD
jgi:hypothetical protein